MAYTISATDGHIVTTIADGTVDTTTSLTLIGKNYAGYGDFLNENLVRLLENGSSNAAPAAPMVGQLWWDKANSLLKVYTGSAFKTVSSSTASPTSPLNAVIGDLWWNTTTNQLNVYNGSSFTFIGPASSSGTGIDVTRITDANSSAHAVLTVSVNNSRIGIISDTAFTPQSAVPGFTTISPGFNLSSDSTYKFVGTSTYAEGLKVGTTTISAANVALTNVSNTFNSPITIANNSGLVIGSSNNFSTTLSGADTVITNNVNNGDIVVRANVGSTLRNVLNIDGSTGLASVYGDPQSDLGIATRQYVRAQFNSNLTQTGTFTLAGNLLPDSTANLRTIGSLLQKFDSIHATYFVGTSMQAQYADLAERFAADQEYQPGTLVAIGGEKEITLSNQELGDDVLGVISTDPAYLMNSGAGSNTTHPAVAVNGRVPVRAIGQVKKGDRLVAAGNGLARAGSRNEITSFNVIGRSLETKTTDGEGTILAIVKLNS